MDGYFSILIRRAGYSFDHRRLRQLATTHDFRRYRPVQHPLGMSIGPGMYRIDHTQSLVWIDDSWKRR